MPFIVNSVQHISNPKFSQIWSIQHHKISLASVTHITQKKVKTRSVKNMTCYPYTLPRIFTPSSPSIKANRSTKMYIPVPTFFSKQSKGKVVSWPTESTIQIALERVSCACLPVSSACKMSLQLNNITSAAEWYYNRFCILLARPQLSTYDTRDPWHNKWCRGVRVSVWFRIGTLVVHSRLFCLHFQYFDVEILDSSDFGKSLAHVSKQKGKEETANNNKMNN